MVDPFRPIIFAHSRFPQSIRDVLNSEPFTRQDLLLSTIADNIVFRARDDVSQGNCI